MPLVNVRLIEGVFTPEQKSEMIHLLTATMMRIESGNLRPVTWVIVEQVKSGDWGHRRQGPRGRRCPRSAGKAPARRPGLEAPAVTPQTRLPRFLAPRTTGSRVRPAASHRKMIRSLDAARASAPVELSCPPLLPRDSIYADLMTTFPAAGRARHSRLYAASRARRNDVRMALDAI